MRQARRWKKVAAPPFRRLQFCAGAIPREKPDTTMNTTTASCPYISQPRYHGPELTGNPGKTPR